MLSLRSIGLTAAIGLLWIAQPARLGAADLEFAPRSNGSLPSGWNCPHPILTTLPGIAVPVQQVTLSSPMEGTVAQILVNESTSVAQGDVLATLDTRELEANLALANATIERTASSHRAEHQLKLAEQNLARTKKLLDQGAAARSRLDQDEAAAEVARTQLSEANEAKREAVLRRNAVQAAIDARTLRAPFSAVVVRVDGQVGQTIRQAEPILSLVNLDRLKVDLHLPASIIDQASVGDDYQLWAASPLNRVIGARLVAKEPIVDAATRTFRCRFEIDNLVAQYPAGFPVALIGTDDAKPRIAGSRPTEKTDLAPSRQSPNIASRHDLPVRAHTSF